MFALTGYHPDFAFIEGLGADTEIAPWPGADGQSQVKAVEAGKADRREVGATGVPGDVR